MIIRIPFFFDPQNYKFVLDHRPEADPVIPFVSAVDVLYTTINTHIGPCELNDIRLVKGIIVPDFSHGYAAEVVIDEETQTVSLVNGDVVHYRASFNADNMATFSGSRIPTRFALSSGTTVPVDYNFLFHGPMLHSIQSINTDNPEQGATGILKTAQGMHWQKTDWLFDPFVCDGALQMGCQLAFMVKNKASLPSKIKRAIFYKKPTTPTVNVTLVFQKISALQYIFDVHIFDSNNTPFCSLEGVESYFRLSKSI